MASAHKKVLVRRSLGDVLAGYLPVSGYVREDAIDLLNLDGRVNSLPLSQVRYICYVRDFNLGDTVQPERITRRAFLARPRAEGLWIRITFRGPSGSTGEIRSPEQMEGLASADLSLLDDLLGDRGLYMTPPDTRSNTQRMFVPRSAISELTVLAVITSPSRRMRPERVARRDTAQDELF